MRYCLLLIIVLTCGACSKSETPGSDVQQTQVSSPSMAADSDEGADVKQSQTEQGIVTEEIEYTVNGEPFTGYLAYDGNIDGPRPGVLVVHEWWGHNAYARSRAEQLAKLGYTAIALDMYGAGKVADHPDNAMQFMQEAISNPEAVKQRFLAAKKLLQDQPTTNPAQIAAIGYCFGGGVVLNMARDGVDIDGVASFHGSLAPVNMAQPGVVTARVLVMHGADDTLVPLEQVEAFKSEMDAAGVDYEFISYPGAKHSFTNPDSTAIGEKYNMPLAYNKEADEQSWRRLHAFLQSLWSQG